MIENTWQRCEICGEKVKKIAELYLIDKFILVILEHISDWERKFYFDINLRHFEDNHISNRYITEKFAIHGLTYGL